MTLETIAQLVDAQIVTQGVPHHRAIQHFFASDLMSDVLYLNNRDNEDTLLVSGLANMQCLITAELLDIKAILFVRGKKLDPSLLASASAKGITCLASELTMYEACGRLWAYEHEYVSRAV